MINLEKSPKTFAVEKYNIHAETRGLETHVTTTCPHCHEASGMIVDTSQFIDWSEGALVQVAFPDMHCNDRERLITGICPACWDELFSDMEEN